MHRTYPVWIDGNTSVLVRTGADECRAQLIIEHGRIDEPAITLIGSLADLQRMIVELDRQISARLLATRHTSH